MKHLFAIVALLCMFTSCKKENISNTPAERKLVKAESTTSSDFKNITYNAEGRLVEYRTNTWYHKYSYSATGPNFETFTSSDVKQYVRESKAMANGRVTNLDHSFYINGSFSSKEENTFQYNAEGYLTGFAYGTYSYVYEVNGGNYTRYTVSNNGTLQREYIIEYYTDKPNKMNVNFMERYLNMYLSDKEEFGKANKNLIKKITCTSTPGSSNDFVENFTYVFDADGYVTSYTVSETTSGGTTSTWGEKFYYQ